MDFVFLYWTDLYSLLDHAALKGLKNPLPASSFRCPLTHHDPKDLGLTCLVKKHKINFWILLDLTPILDFLKETHPKKIIFQLRFLLSQSQFFTRGLEQIFLPPIFCNALNFLATKLCIDKMAVHKYTEREHTGQVLEVRFYFNYFTHYYGTDTQGNQQFIPIFGWFDMVQIPNDWYM